MFLIEEFSQKFPVIVFFLSIFPFNIQMFLNRVQRKLLAFLNYSPLILFPPIFLYSHSLLSCLSCLLFFSFYDCENETPLCVNSFSSIQKQQVLLFFLYIHTQHTYITTNNKLAAAASIHTVHKYIYYVMFVDVFKGGGFLLSIA